MINCTYNLWDYELLPKRLEIFEKYTKILQWGRANPTRFIEDFLKIQLTDHQKWMILSSWAPSTVVWLCSRATRKATSLDTPVYFKIKDRGNKYEKKTVGELQIGDLIYDDQGGLTEVLHLNPVVFDDCYEVEFEDGDKIRCNADHLWYVRDVNFDKNNKYENKFVTRSTDFIYNHFNDRKKKDGYNDYRFYVPLSKPIKYPDYQYLPIPPYALGVWLGDGTSTNSGITSDNNDCQEMKQHLLDCGITSVEVIKPWGRDTISTLFLDRKKGNPDLTKKQLFTEKLKDMNLLSNKHIPERYMYATVEERLELLQGLMDTDGTVDKRNGNCSFSQANCEFCLQLQKLLSSLGIKSTVTEKKMHYIKKDGTLARSWEVFFTTGKDFPCFKLQRKLKYLKDTRSEYQKQKAIINVTKTEKKIPMRCITVSNKSGLFLCGNNYTVTHNSFMASVFLMTRALLLPNTNSYIMGPSGRQAQETFQKMEDIAKGNIASLMGTSSVFLDECVRMNSSADPFTHAKTSYSVSLYNGSTINTLNSVAKNIVGIRSNFSVFDEAGKIDRDFYALTLPFTVQNMNFVTGSGINNEIYPTQMQNKNLFLSSAEGIDSYLFDMYKLCFQKMLLGDPDYFVCDIDCNFSLHPFMNGKPYQAQLTQKTVDDAMATNPYRAQREQIEKKYSAHLAISVCIPLNCWEFLKVFVLQHNYEIRISANVTKVKRNKNMVHG